MDEPKYGRRHLPSGKYELCVEIFDPVDAKKMARLMDEFLNKTKSAAGFKYPKIDVLVESPSKICIRGQSQDDVNQAVDRLADIQNAVAKFRAAWKKRWSGV